MNIYSLDEMYESYSGEVERMQKCIDELLKENEQLKVKIIDAINYIRGTKYAERNHSNNKFSSKRHSNL